MPNHFSEYLNLTKVSKELQDLLSAKASIRKKIIANRDALARQEIIARSQEIKKRLFGLPEFNKAATVMFYASIKSEVDTLATINQTLSNSKKVVLPLVDLEKQSLLPYLITDYNTELEKGVWGILQPNQELTKLVNPKEIDLVIVPGIAFDQAGHRLGYGKGFYDRFLPQLKTKASSVGLAFELQIADALPHTQQDVAVDKIITEKRIIDCCGS